MRVQTGPGGTNQVSRRAVLQESVVENHLLVLVIGRDLDRIDNAITHDVSRD